MSRELSQFISTLKVNTLFISFFSFFQRKERGRDRKRKKEREREGERERQTENERERERGKGRERERNETESNVLSTAYKIVSKIVSHLYENK